MIRIEELDIEVEDIEDFNSRASEILEEFCMDLHKVPGMSRPADPEVDSFLDETNLTFIWINGASKLIETEQTRLYHIGEKYFGRPNIELDIETSWFVEP